MYVNGELAGFTSTLHFVHPRVKNTRQGHRTVVLPDFQGIGLGVHITNFVAEWYLQQGKTYIMTISNPALTHAMKKSPKWICTRFGRTTVVLNAHKGIGSLNKAVSGVSRITTSWKYVGDKKQ
jgi:GNAT superfamily N-acetyltransferase